MTTILGCECDEPNGIHESWCPAVAGGRKGRNPSSEAGLRVDALAQYNAFCDEAELNEDERSVAGLAFEAGWRAALAKEARDVGPRNATSCVVGIAIEPQHAPPGQPEIVKDCPGYQCLCCNRPSIYALQMRYVLSPLCSSCIKALREELAARDAAKELTK